MATAHTIRISPSNTGLWQFEQSEPVAKKASELLQKDLETNHVFFNHDGFHNHISHHILALYGTGAPAGVLEQGYVENEGYQRPAMPVHERDDPTVQLRDWEAAQKRLGKEQYYADFLSFYQAEIERLGGWREVLSEYMFKGDARSDDTCVRMHAGFLHPLIQLMYGVEWDQPAMVAMALAQASVHSDKGLREYLLAAETAAASTTAPMPTIAELLDAVAADEKLAHSARLSDANKFRDGVLKRAWDEMIAVAGRVKVRPDELEERTAEMYHTSIYEGASAAIREGKDTKWDFFLIHHINVCPIYLTLNAQDWIPLQSKVRLLEWKIRLDLTQYAARACPQLSLNKIASYTPKKAGPIADLLPRIHTLEDDGHAVKLLRAVGVAWQTLKKYEDRPWAKIKGDSLWTNVAHLVVDSVESPKPNWVRGAGDPGAWEEVRDRPATDDSALGRV